MAPFFLPARLHPNNKRFKLNLKTEKKKSGMKNMQDKFKRLKVQMEEISEEQKNVREGQRQVREKFEAIESECEELKRESARTQIKLAIMFQFVRASQQVDFATVAKLTRLLREIEGRENEET